MKVKEKLLIKKTAFTLSEVLITLGVIGVVAAITMPTLIQNHQKTTLVNQLKSTYSLLNQGFQKMKADDGVDNIDDTSVWLSISGNYCQANNSTNCEDFFQNLKKYFKIVSIEPLTNYTWKYLNSSTLQTDYTGNDNVISLVNGAMIWYYEFRNPIEMSDSCKAIQEAGGHMCGHAGQFYLDVNGKKGPNTMGRDIFYFSISEKGALIPYGGFDYWLHSYSGVKDRVPTEDRICNASSDGLDCAARIITNGWKMEY